ncbi:UDP-glucose:glycoprotein glucosyltransferase 2 isoform X1 [Chiloscyllium plagiosum]|uniref:UDP-glucose:glycoprotein glucosyltransferase 2 isoform X1 n=2 Tax=Chiloscyllium plagiosum TaxID=36176 RepID=UPI001CB88415|nr:UDP-glucose:glycoprotein glucosyltransferase 2 isoform X1 [Chiloscyllium plagiosum]XP_043547392.1 UDP-glucose:glycoprotein glucosyltransferase 2 isoform X1 [Chiloscyllium plagiosum]XP_043547393.1 UDP-glucose:glycoprotein glucosyltransferase 2 isoform X1 [Chiloscyllium plagiosum]
MAASRTDLFPKVMALPFIVLILRFCNTQAAGKGVTVSLDAKWPSTPLLLETSEFVAEEDDEKFWQFIDTVKEITYIQGDSERSYYDLILKKAGQFLSELKLNLLKFALSLRAYSPAVQMFQQTATDEPPPKGCSSFVAVHGEHTCNTNEVKKLLKRAANRPKPYLFKGDHIFPTKNSEAPVAILYAEIGTKEFSKFHKVLSEKASKGALIYVLRHYVQKTSLKKVHLSGYGVELAIKSTEYKAVDDTHFEGTNNTVLEDDDDIDEVQGFHFRKLKQLYPDLTGQLKELRKHLIESTNDMAPLKVWELQDLSFQAAARILSAPVYDALKLMRDFSQNLPTKARSLTRIAVNQGIRDEIEANQKFLAETLGFQPGDSALFLNGMRIDLDTHSPFSILDILKQEGKVMDGLYNLGIQDKDLSKLLSLNVHPMEESPALDIRHSAIIWITDLERDQKYRSWPSNYQELLRPTFPGVIRQIRRNFFNLVMFIDPAQEEAVQLIKLAELFYQHNIPLRIGFIFVVNADEEIDGNLDAGVALLRVFNFIAEDSELSHAFSSIVAIFNQVQDGESLTVDNVVSFMKKKYPRVDVQNILGVDSEFDDQRKAGASYYKTTGLGSLPQAVFNGIHFNIDDLDSEELETIILQKIMDAAGFFQKAVFMGQLNEHIDVVDFLMDQPNVVHRINPVILNAERKYLDLTSKADLSDWNDFTTYSFLDVRDKSAVIADQMKYLTRKDEDIIYAVTIWIIADFDKLSGRRLLLNTIKHMKVSSNIRIGVISNHAAEITENTTPISKAIWAVLLTQNGNIARNYITKLLSEETADALVSGAKIMEFAVKGMDNDAFEKKYNTIGVNFLRTHRLFCQDVLKLLPGQEAVVSNGRILGAFNANETFHPEDFSLLERITLSTSSEKIKAHIKRMGLHSKSGSDLLMKVDALLSSMPKMESRKDVKFPQDQLSVVKIKPQDGVFYEVVVILDPLSREAQRMAPLLMVLHQVVNMKLKVFMNCRPKLSELPLKSFYRYVLEPRLVFTADNNLSAGPIAKFLEMPEVPLFTLNMITPESWLVESVRSPYDLDNIHLEDVEGIVSAEYELEYILLEGHCFDVTMGQPPRGLQFTLGMKHNPVMVDTIVMANLGYFQLKANPGTWLLRLRKGRSSNIYQIFMHEGTDSPDDADDVAVVLNSFKSKILKVQVNKKPDKINEDLLSDVDTEDKGIWESITSFAEGFRSEQKDDVLNIFSVASGHLYERFLRIMMLSVLKHTKSTVKFWFLKNYLSPTFKEFIPEMANEYGFQYELVQYKWPRWLHQQTEKQRIIWGYKILFLDVLFPLAVNKIIFVDADQIVRTDLKELEELDLEGAPYGYTPFCDSRKEMDGYRFWNSGYWASHLGGRKYHISALYVVDLKRFRKIAAGDRLRGQYQALSQDPNSLSNLDQDLPNNMIHQVAIKSLPQEWLWCETWCSEESKKIAKTIDLCNNPRTKEPKLKAAMRIVPEWNDYDNEIKMLLKRVEGQRRNSHTKSKSQSQAPGRDEL